MTTEEQKAKALADLEITGYDHDWISHSEFIDRHRDTIRAALAPAEVTQPSEPVAWQKYASGKPAGEPTRDEHRIFQWKMDGWNDKNNGLEIRPLYAESVVDKATALPAALENIRCESLDELAVNIANKTIQQHEADQP